MQKYGGNNIFPKIGGNELKQLKIGGITNLEKRSSEILADEHRIFFSEKVKLRKFSTESENVFHKYGGSEAEEMHHCLKGRWAPLR